MSESNKGVSLLPQDAQQGGFLDDADVTFKSVEAEIFDFNGKGKPGTCIKVTFETQDGQERVEYYRAGSPEKLIPSGDKKRILPVAGATGIMAKSKAFHLITSIINAGFPADKVSDDLSVFAGLEAHVANTTLPEKITDRESGQERENKAVLVTKINRLPWEKPQGGAKQSGRAAKAAAPIQTSAPAPANDAVNEQAQAVIVRALSENGGSLNRVKLNQTVFKLAAQDPNRNAIVKALTVDFLKSLDGTPVEVGGDVQTLQSDGQTISLVAA